MTVFTYLAAEPQAVLIVVALLGLIIGSFLNVVIYRLPIMMEREWQEQCHESVSKTMQDFNLMVPRSRCPHCQHQITALENIPILSYIWQRGKCTACHKSISIRYPLIEALSAILAVLTAVHFGFGWPLLAALVLTWALLASSMIDFDHQLLPDDILLPLLWLGILCHVFGLYNITLESSVIGAMVGYVSLWSIYWIFKRITGKEGMGYGDFKLLAVLGAWMGWQMLPIIILLSSIVGASVGILLIIFYKHNKDVPIPFGPYLAAAGWISLLWGEQLTQLLWAIH